MPFIYNSNTTESTTTSGVCHRGGSHRNAVKIEDIRDGFVLFQPTQQYLVGQVRVKFPAQLDGSVIVQIGRLEDSCVDALLNIFEKFISMPNKNSSVYHVKRERLPEDANGNPITSTCSSRHKNIEVCFREDYARWISKIRRNDYICLQGFTVDRCIDRQCIEDNPCRLIVSRAHLHAAVYVGLPLTTRSLIHVASASCPYLEELELQEMKYSGNNPRANSSEPEGRTSHATGTDQQRPDIAPEEQARGKYEYTKIHDLVPSRSPVNVMGVVCFFKPPSSTKRGDLYQIFTLLDEDCQHDQDRPLKVVAFRASGEDFPPVYSIGDIVRFIGLPIGSHAGNNQLKITNHTELTSETFAVFPFESNDAIPRPGYGGKVPSVDAVDEARVKALREWAFTRNEFPRLEFKSIHELKFNGTGLGSCVCQVIDVKSVSLVRPDVACILVRVWDGTVPASLCPDQSESGFIKFFKDCGQFDSDKITAVLEIFVRRPNSLFDFEAFERRGEGMCGGGVAKEDLKSLVNIKDDDVLVCRNVKCSTTACDDGSPLLFMQAPHASTAQINNLKGPDKERRSLSQKSDLEEVNKESEIVIQRVCKIVSLINSKGKDPDPQNTYQDGQHEIDEFSSYDDIDLSMVDHLEREAKARGKDSLNTFSGCGPRNSELKQIAFSTINDILEDFNSCRSNLKEDAIVKVYRVKQVKILDILPSVIESMLCFHCLGCGLDIEESERSLFFCDDLTCKSCKKKAEVVCACRLVIGQGEGTDAAKLEVILEGVVWKRLFGIVDEVSEGVLTEDQRKLVSNALSNFSRLYAGKVIEDIYLLSNPVVEMLRSPDGAVQHEYSMSYYVISKYF
eukprot:Nk52_evm5s284 gene=Nk52_evmTU5s284